MNGNAIIASKIILTLNTGIFNTNDIQMKSTSLSTNVNAKNIPIQSLKNGVVDMNPKNDWLDWQLKMLRADSHKKKQGETWMLCRFLCLLVPLLFYAISLHAIPASKMYIKHPSVKQADGGVHFTCKRCRPVQWQDKNQADWKGDYYCRRCGCKMGEE
jgi:hypothetical protein